MSPLVGLFLMSALFQTLFNQDLATLCGAILGGVGGFLLARSFRQNWRIVPNGSR
jgi:sigma-E factor negative regulatory protein RseC